MVNFKYRHKILSRPFQIAEESHHDHKLVLRFQAQFFSYGRDEVEAKFV